MINLFVTFSQHDLFKALKELPGLYFSYLSTKINCRSLMIFCKLVLLWFLSCLSIQNNSNVNCISLPKSSFFELTQRKNQYIPFGFFKPKLYLVSALTIFRPYSVTPHYWLKRKHLAAYLREGKILEGQIIFITTQKWVTARPTNVWQICVWTSSIFLSYWYRDTKYWFP